MPNWREAKEEMEEEERHKLIFPTFPFERLRRKASGRLARGSSQACSVGAEYYNGEQLPQGGERERGDGG